MLKVDRSAGKLVKLAEPTLSTAGWEERSSLQELILHNADEFFQQECHETLFILRDEVEPSVEVGDRIDLLAIDNDGKAVVIELKRGSHKLQLLQSLSYAAMISDWEVEQFEALIPESKRELFNVFFGEHDLENINEFQRVILIAESFDFEVLKTAEWLTASGINITCYKLQLAKDGDGGTEYLSVVQIFPPRELAKQARRRGSLRSERANKFPEIEQLLPMCGNTEIVSYFTASLAMRRNRRRNSLVYPPTGKMRFRVMPKNGYARVSQLGRFDGDQAFWNEQLSQATLKARPSDLRFRLNNEGDLKAFTSFAEEKLSGTVWTKSAADDEGEDNGD
ncbi:MAG TPA: hypothetical protein VIJ79_00870 [Acidobacteriaceae bacterium]